LNRIKIKALNKLERERRIPVLQAFHEKRDSVIRKAGCDPWEVGADEADKIFENYLDNDKKSAIIRL